MDLWSLGGNSTLTVALVASMIIPIPISAPLLSPSVRACSIAAKFFHNVERRGCIREAGRGCGTARRKRVWPLLAGGPDYVEDSWESCEGGCDKRGNRIMGKQTRAWAVSLHEPGVQRIEWSEVRGKVWGYIIEFMAVGIGSDVNVVEWKHE